MSNRSGRRQTRIAPFSRTDRSPSGQALAEGTVALMLLVAAFVLMVAFGINAFFVTQWSAKVNVVASEAAKVVAANRYWLGMERPDYDPSAAHASATQVAQKLCQRLGLPNPNITFPDVPSDESGDYNQVVVTVSSLPLPFKIDQVFPNIIGVQGTGISFQPKQRIYAHINIHAPTSAPNQWDGVAIPVYGFFRGINSNPNAFADPQNVQGGYGAAVSLPNNFGQLGSLNSKYFRGLPLPPPIQWDPHLIEGPTNPDTTPNLTGTSQ